MHESEKSNRRIFLSAPIPTIKGLTVWRTFLTVCLFGMLCCKDVQAATLATSSDDTAQQRIALVIGNGAYQENPLPENPVNDARAMGAALHTLGFDIMLHENLTGERMRSALDAFARRVGEGGIGIVYFAGHGLQVGDRTLLLPTDTDSRNPSRLMADAVDLRTVLDSMAAPRPGKANLVILDTCLNNPFDPERNTAMRPAAPPAQTLIAYATAPGAFAADTARHGLYTAKLLKALAAPGQEIGQALRLAAASVHAASGGRQAPWLASSLRKPLAIALPVKGVANDDTVIDAHSRGVLPKDSAEQYELTFWDSIKNSTHASDYEAYLQAYPNGRFAALARARIERLRAGVPAPDKPQTPATQARPAQPAKPPPPERARAAPKPAPEPEERAAEAAAAAPKADLGDIKDCAGCPELVKLPAGAFTMGSQAGDPSEKPAHRVTLKVPFAIGKYEVTVGQWTACVEAGACPRIATAGTAARAPMRDVSWDDAQTYVKWLVKTTGQPYRLPTEAEWEYAARGGTTTKFWWGDQMRKGNANCKDCGEPWQQDAPADVGSFAANPYRLHDMNGSVWEWVSDCWHNSYKGAPSDGHAWDEKNCRVRVIRGGSWRDGESYMPSSTRFKYDASVRQSQNGFRVARDVK